MKIKHALFSLVTGLTLATCMLPAQAGGWQLTELGTLGGASSFAFGMNNAGQVVGYSDDATGTPYPAIWRNGVVAKLGTRGGAALFVNSRGVAAGNVASVDSTRMDATLLVGARAIDLGTFGGSLSLVYGLNNLGQVIGNARTADEQDHAFLATGAGMRDLGTLGGQYSYAYGINNYGQVVGNSQTATGQAHCFLYSGGVMTDIGTLGGAGCFAVAINDAGQVTGQSTASTGSRAFIYNGRTMTDLGTLGGSTSVGKAINQAGQVVGVARTANNEQHAFIYTGTRMVDMGTLGGTSSTPTAININGQVVGNSTLANGVKQPFFYSNGIMINLNTVLPQLSNIDPNRIYLNDAGQIAGTGTINGQQRAFLLTPTP